MEKWSKKELESIGIIVGKLFELIKMQSGIEKAEEVTRPIRDWLVIEDNNPNKE